MSIDRVELHTKLQAVAPALADTDLDKKLTHFVFTGTRLLAYNDRIAISMPLASDFKGTIEGDLLRDYVGMATHAKSVTLTPEHGKVRLTLGKSKVHLDTLPLAAYTFSMPAAPKPTEGKLESVEFFIAIENVLKSCGGPARIIEQLGVTFIPNGGKVKMFATDRATISFAQLPLPQLGLKKKSMVPADFCRQMLTMRDADKKQLVFRDDHALFVADDTLMFTKLLRGEGRADFDDALRQALPADFPNGIAQMDNSNKQYDRLRTLFKMASRLHDIKGNTVKTTIRVRDNTVHMNAVSPRGNVEDSTKVTAHGNVEVPVDASLVYGRYDRYRTLQITDQCVVLANGPDSLCIVSLPD